VIGQFSHDGIALKTRVKFVISHWSVSIPPFLVKLSGLRSRCIVSQIKSICWKSDSRFCLTSRITPLKGASSCWDLLRCVCFWLMDKLSRISLSILCHLIGEINHCVVDLFNNSYINREVLVCLNQALDSISFHLDQMLLSSQSLGSSL